MQYGLQKLVLAFQRGEEWAFSKLYSHYRKPIFRYVSQRISDREAAEDLIQEIFLKVFRFRGSYQPKYAFSTWLWTISKNTLSDWFRRNGQEHVPVMDDELPCLQPSAELLLEQKSERQMLTAVLGKLTDLQRQVLRMSLVQHLPYKEIAQTLGISLSAVKCLVYRSKRALEELGPSSGFALDGI